MQRIFDSRQLLAFSTLSRAGTFTQTAKELSLTQSAISHAIACLEDELGCTLVERGPKRASLTHAGEVFLQHVERSLAAMDAGRASLDAISNWGEGRIRLGASSTSCQYILPTVLREFKQCFPKCAISIESGDHPRQLELLTDRQIDLAILLKPTPNRELSYVPLFEDELKFMAVPVHPWARAGKVSRDEVRKETLVMYNKTSYTFRLIGDYLRHQRIAIGQVIELGSMEAIKELVRVGVGVGILAPWVAREEIEKGSLVSLPIGKRPLRRSWGISYLKGRKLTLAEEVFVGLCKTVTEGYGAVG